MFKQAERRRAMRHVAGLAAVLALAGSVLALEPAEAQQQRLAEIQALLDGGQCAEAVEAARPFAASVRDKDTKTEAMRLLAEALRKNGDWALAAKAYQDLAGRQEKGAEAQVRAQGTAEILLKSPQGVYAGLKKPIAEGEGGELKPRTLAEDAVLAEALAATGEARAAALGPKVEAMKRLAAPAEVVAALEEIVGGYREARMLAPKMSYEAEQGAAKGAADRLEGLGNEVKPKLREKLSEMDKAASDHGGLDSAQKKEAEDYQEVCRKSAEAEDKFREMMRDVGGPGWPDRLQLIFESTKRNHEYGLLALGFRNVSARDGGLLRRRVRRP